MTTPRLAGVCVELYGDLDLTLFAEALERASRETEGSKDAVGGDFSDPSPSVPSRSNVSPEFMDLTHHPDPRLELAARVRQGIDEACVPGEDPMGANVLFRLGEQKFVWFHRSLAIPLDCSGLYETARRTAGHYRELTGDSAATSSGNRPGPGVFLANVASRTSFAAPAGSHVPSKRPAQQHRPGPTRTQTGDRSGGRVARSETALNEGWDVRLRTAETLHGVSWPVLILAATAAALSADGGTDEVVLGLLGAGRLRPMTDGTSGMVADTLPLSVEVRPEQPIGEFVSTVARLMHDVVAVERYGQGDLSTVRDERPLSRPLIRLIPADVQLEFGPLRGALRPVATGPVGDVSITVLGSLRQDGSFTAQLLVEAATARHEPDFAQALATRLTEFMGAFLDASPDLPLGRLPYLPVPDRTRLVQGMSGPSVEVDRLDLARLFESRVITSPDVPAVLCADTCLTYTSLNEQANRLARLMISSGAGPERIVALVLPRTADAIVAVLAVAKAGAAYLPIDPEYPSDRIAFMLDDARPVCAVTTSGLENRLPASLARIVLDSTAVREELATLSPANVTDAERRSPVRLDNAAYVIYTSGSTGRPKGVVIQHSGLANLAETHAVPSGSRVLLFAPLSFDASVADICAALLSGATLVVPNEQQRVPGEPLAEFACRHGITHLTLPPSALRHMPAKSLPSGAVVISAGEALTPDLIARWAGWVEVRNVYGQTETTVAATMSGPLDGGQAPDAGPPLWNTRIYVLDNALRPVREGVAGEIYVAGMGMGRGYLNRPELTAERYVADPFGNPGDRMYRSGDMGMWRADGTLEIAGRVDDQLKINGFRIEPAEIEAALVACRGVTEAAVVPVTVGTADESGERPTRLAAYLVGGAQDEPLAVTRIRDQLAATLPRHMLPMSFQFVSELPLTSNGKLDKAALPRPTTGSAGPRMARSNAEKALCECFAAVLGAQYGVAPDDDFFLLGGDSVKALHVVGRAREAGWEVTPQDVFRKPTAAALATVARRLGEDGVDPVAPPNADL